LESEKKEEKKVERLLLFWFPTARGLDQYLKPDPNEARSSRRKSTRVSIIGVARWR
jgi:hypothetical protein